MRGRTPLVLRRAFSEPLLLFAALGSILLATTSLVALAMYASSVAEVGVRRTMETAPAAITAITVSSPVRQATFAGADRSVRDAVARQVGGHRVPAAVTVSVRSDSYAMPGQQYRRRPELTRFGFAEGLDRHARLSEGAWPRPAARGEPAEVALSQPAARAMGLSLGQEFTVVGRLDDRPARARVSGVFRLADPYDERWRGDELLRGGVERGNYTTYGPLLVAKETFLTRFAGGSVSATWTAAPDLSALAPGGLRPLAASVGALGDTVRRDCPECTTFSRLPDMLTQLDQAALVARSTMLVPVLQLLLLAAYALVLTARLLAEHRRMEVALLRSRGAGGPAIALLAGGEALLVAVPCAVAAPFLAPLLLTLVNRIPWIRSSGIRLAPTPDVLAFTVSAGVALACAVLLALPALRGSRRTYIEEQAARGRGDRRGLLERAGGDLALLVVAALAIWQLQRYGAPVTATAGGGLGIDPLIVTGPALALLCGGMLGLRLVPRISRLAELFTSRRPGLAPALGAWQVSRRPMRYSGPALLLTMAVAIGVVSMATAATWRTSQIDQARHQAAADLRVVVPPDNARLGSLGRGPAYAALDGVTGLSPVHRGTVSFNATTPMLIAADAGKLDRLMLLRDDLTAGPVATLAGRLAAGRPAVPGLELPGRPRALSMDARLTLDRGKARKAYDTTGLRAVVTDALGVSKEVRAGPAGLTGRPRRVTFDLAALAGREGRLAYPLRLRGLLLDIPVPGSGTGLRLDLTDAETDAGSAVALQAGLAWAPGVRGTDRVSGARATTGPALLTLTVPAPADADQGDGPGEYAVVAAMAVPAGAPPADYFLPPDRPGARIFGPLPIVVTADLATAEKLVQGRTTGMNLDGRPVLVQVAGIVEAMPGTPAGTPAVLADLPTLQTRDAFDGRDPRPVVEWWISARDDRTAPVRAELARHLDWDQTIIDLDTLTRRLRDDPLASGLQGALVLGFAAALVFALLGFLVNAAVAARERAAEFAILRALGVSFRQIFGLLAVEQTFMIGLSLLGGTLLAVVVATLVVPHIVLTGQAASVTPPVLLDIPWPATLALLAAVAVLLFAIVAGLARSLRRQGLGRALRIGEDR
ncbi:hypothetical protein Sru01_33010 [Sphaerisporangium rufum]|uniref:ABC3 transporter permease C-terminal domain-containing protein n=1 Tax=Sphaerisporangium rufum TaxID=1381558 RepID=A0A919R2C6_9ACTN|nr:FtsX-like permease family protein [Sphaerisporangium rufum]GII78319.1 hypothetical protein Sru01_33010 [Sphaerisporangium rufum]